MKVTLKVGEKLEVVMPDGKKVNIVGADSRMNLTEVRKQLLETDGKIFSVRFKKRTDGSIREMICRTGVKKYLKDDPKKPGINFKANNLISVYDMEAKGYRSIPLEGVIGFKSGGDWIEVNNDLEST